MMTTRAFLSAMAGQKMLRELPLKPWAGCRREDLLGLLAMLNHQIGKLDAAVQKAAEENPQARLLMTQPGVGPNTALAFVLTIGDVSRFGRGKQIASYLGLIPREESSGGRQKLGAIRPKQRKPAYDSFATLGMIHRTIRVEIGATAGNETVNYGAYNFLSQSYAAVESHPNVAKARP